MLQSQPKRKISNDLFEKNIDMLTFDYFEDSSIKPSSCLRLNQIIGEAYGTLIGLSLADLAPYKKGFMLANVVLEIGKKHKFESSLRGQSWSNGIDKRLLVRSLEFHNNAGDYVFGCTNYFLVVDLEKRKAIWPSDLPIEFSGYNNKYGVKNPDYMFEIDAPLKEVEKRMIRRGDIDALGHINNSVYAAFGTDNLTDEALARGINRMVIRFFTEIKHGETIKILRGDKNNNIYFVGQNQAGEINFHILFEMNK
jgi:acyl-ACP thioesterase